MTETDPTEVIRRLCALSALVATEVHDHAYTADCFCGAVERSWAWRHEMRSIEFIEEATLILVAKTTEKPIADLRAALQDAYKSGRRMESERVQGRRRRSLLRWRLTNR